MDSFRLQMVFGEFLIIGNNTTMANADLVDLYKLAIDPNGLLYIGTYWGRARTV